MKDLSDSRKQFKELVRVGDVFTSLHTEKELSQTIADITDGEWSHTFMYIGHGVVAEVAIHKGKWGGQVTDLDYYLENPYNLRMLRMKNPDNAVLKKVAKNTKGFIGVKYGFLQIVWDLFLRLIGKSENPRWHVDVDPGMVCSEAIGWAFWKEGIAIKPGFKPAGLEPVDFVQSEIFEVIHEDYYNK